MANQSRTPNDRNSKSNAPTRASRPAGPQSAGNAPGLASAVQRATTGDLSDVRPTDVIALQRSVGNRAANTAMSGSAQPSAWRRPSLPIQAKLTVGAADESYEQEADKVAGQVMRMSTPPTPPAEGQPASTVQPMLLRRAPQEEDELQTERDDALGSFETGPDFEGRLQASRGSGAPLPHTLRREMEPKFGADFGGVRVHTSTESATLNRQVQAKAFTHGGDIHFASGQYNPASTSGKQLIAHELTHTVQQGAAPTGVQASRLQRAAGPSIQREEAYEAADDPDEAEVAPDPSYDRPGRLITKNTSLYEEAGKKKKVAGAKQLKKDDFVARRGGSEEVTSRSWGREKKRIWQKVQVIQQGGLDVQDSNIEGYVKADHLKAFYSHQEQTGIPLLSPGKMPSPKDVIQGNIGDCYLMAAMMTLASNMPRTLMNMFKPGIYDATSNEVAVRFFETDKSSKDHRLTVPGAAKWVKVKKSVIVAGNAYFRAKFEKGGKVLAKGPELWPSIIEKAYAAYNNTNYEGLAGAGFILNNISSVMTVLAGVPQKMESTDYEYAATQTTAKEGESKEQFMARLKRETAERIIAILNKGGTIFAGTGQSATTRQKKQKLDMGLEDEGTGSAGESKAAGLASGHAYEVKGLKKKGGKLYVQVRNPWGEYGRTEYNSEGAYGVAKDKAGAVSWVEINDFLDGFKKLHHSLSEDEVNLAKETLEDTDFLETVEL